MLTSPDSRVRFRKLALTVLAASSFGAQSSTWAASASDDVFPPWQQGKNNDALDRGLNFTVPQVDVLADFHGDLSSPKLVLFVGGNYFFAMASLVEQFEKDNPAYRGRIFWETIPPGLLVKQMKAGGTITVGNMTWTVKPDAYFAGLGKVKELIADGTLAAPAVPYVTNQLTIMVQKGNPKNIASLPISLSQPYDWRCPTQRSRASRDKSSRRLSRQVATRSRKRSTTIKHGPAPPNSPTSIIGRPPFF